MSNLTSKAIRFYAVGGPEVLLWETVEVADPAPGEVRIQQHACGLNFIDIYHRTGLYPMPLPSGIGMEGAGVVESVGAGVSLFKAGDRVAYAGGPLGAYAQVRCIPADRLLMLPDRLSFETGAAMMLQGLTAAYLLRKTYRVQAGDAVLVHAAAGGVGTLLCQWANALGATVIGTVSTPEKAAQAKAHGCAHVVLYGQEDVAQRVREITQGSGVAVVYDGVGKDTFNASIDSLRVRGMLVCFGNASGPVPPIDPLLLTSKGSLFITRPSLMHYIAQRAELEELANELMQMVTTGKVKVEINHRYALEEAASAQRDLAERKTTGSVVLLP